MFYLLVCSLLPHHNMSSMQAGFYVLFPTAALLPTTPPGMWQVCKYCELPENINAWPDNQIRLCNSMLHILSHLSSSPQKDNRTDLAFLRSSDFLPNIPRQMLWFYTFLNNNWLSYKFHSPQLFDLVSIQGISTKKQKYTTNRSRNPCGFFHPSRVTQNAITISLINYH